MDLTTLLIILIIFIIFFSISFMIQDMKYRVSYYMILALLFLASLNIYLSIVEFSDSKLEIAQFDAEHQVIDNLLPRLDSCTTT